MRTSVIALVLLVAFSMFAMASPTSVASDAIAKVQQEVTYDVIKFGLVIGVFTIVGGIIQAVFWERKRQERKRYYNEDYLQSDAWKRKRYVVLRRDKWKCVYCGAKATDVHHKRYARLIGKEPIDWLVSVCPRCHASEHEEK